MRYKLENGKEVNIPEVEIENNMKLDLTREEAIQVWLEDEGYLDNEEQEALMTKTKGMRVDVGAKSDKPRAKRTVERKEDAVKEEVIAKTAAMLAEIADNVKIENVGKLITFRIGDDEFKFDLIRKRKGKK